MSTQNNTIAVPDWLEELDGLIARVERHQRHLGINDPRFAARYQIFLKSGDTWTRTLKARDLTRLSPRNVGKWTKLLGELIAEIEDASGGETVYPLPILRAATQLYDRLQAAKGDVRVGWLLGTTGVGKSVSLRYLHKTHPAETAYIVVPELWRDNRTALTSGIAEALGLEPAHTAAGTLNKIFARLLEQPMTLFVDEMHEGGILLVKLIKSLIEKTKTRFILTTWPSGYRRLCTGPEGFGETRQLVGRSLRPIVQEWVGGPRIEDVRVFLQHAAPELDKTGINEAAKDALPAVRKWGFRLCWQAVEAARSSATDDAPMTAETLRETVNAMSGDVL
jgi:hypothetical protein